MTVEEKIKELKSSTLKEFDKKFGENSYYLGDKTIPPVPLICSSGSLSLDNALVIGGFPEGRIIEIGGQESSGKSTLTLINIAEVQKNNKICAYLDIEQSFDPDYAAKLNVDVKNLIITKPETTEETFDMLFDLMKSGLVSYIVVDSTNAMIPQRMLEGDSSTSMMGKNALLFSQNLPKVVSLASTTKCTVVFLSQIRSKIGVTYGSPDVVGVGNAMKFAASIRIKTSKSEVQKDDGEEGQSSVDINMNVFKNKVGVPNRKATFTLLTGQDGKFGIDTNKEVLEFAVKFEIIKKAGSWFSYGDERLGQGMPNVIKYFEEHVDTFTNIKNNILSKLKQEREKAQAVQPNSFNAQMIKIASEIEEKPKRARKTRMDGNMEEISIVETKVSDAEVTVEEVEESK